MVAVGCVMGGIGSWYMTLIYTQIDFRNITMPGIVRGLAAGLIFLPLTTLSLAAVSLEDMGTASGLFNMVRTIGGSIGIAILVAMLSTGAQVHQSYLATHVDAFHISMLQRALPTTSGPFANFGQHGGGLTMLYAEVERQATVMAFVDDFRLIAYIFFVMAPLSLLMRKPALTIGGAVAH